MCETGSAGSQACAPDPRRLERNSPSGDSGLLSRRVDRGFAPRVPHRSGRESLDSSGSCHPEEACRLPPRQGVDTENPVRIENAGIRSVREIIIVSIMTPFFIALLVLFASHGGFAADVIRFNISD